MPKLKFSGPLSTRLQSFWALNKIGASTLVRHAKGQKIAPDWDANFETGIRYWRRQFTKAMTLDDIAQGRVLFDSVQTESDDKYPVTVEPTATPKGHWITPENVTSKATLLYFHGGGYTFYGGVSKRFAAMLAHHTGARLFVPDYRLTPEHPHPAQAEDAQAAWRYVTANTPPDKTVIIGDSAGGHMALMLLQTLKAEPQPALCIGLCPWTDIGNRGASLTNNDPFDLVQGWMALQFGTWLDPKSAFGRKALSPIFHDFKGLAPLYLQVGGREVLRDMIVEFAQIQAQNGAPVMLDLWSDMPHDFQAFDSLKLSSTQALQRIREAIDAKTSAAPALCAQEGVTQVNTL